MKTYEVGQRAIYEEDGASAVVEVMGRELRGSTERYVLNVIELLNFSQPIYVGPLDGTKEGPNENGLGFVRAFKPGQVLKVNRNIEFTGFCQGMWTLTDVVEEECRQPGFP